MPEDVQFHIFSNLKTHYSILYLRETSKTQNKIVNAILRSEYEQELCDFFKNLRISRQMEDGSLRIKDIIMKNFSFYRHPSRMKCLFCGCYTMKGILCCECPKKKLKRIFLGPMIAAIGCVFLLRFVFPYCRVKFFSPIQCK